MNNSLKYKLKEMPEFEIAEALLSQNPQKILNIFRIVNNKKYSDKILSLIYQRFIESAV